MHLLKSICLCVATSIFLFGCASVPEGELDFSGAKPPLASGGKVTASKTFTVDAPAKDIVQHLIHMPLQEVFTEGSSLPAVADTEVLTASWGAVGDRRSVLLADGHRAAEELLEIKSDRSFKYQVWGFTTEAKFLADYATGEFIVEEIDDSNAKITWVYQFKANSVVSRLPLYLFVQLAWKTYMDDAIDNMRRSIESIRVSDIEALNLTTELNQ